jgi:hypothetical protein
MANLDQPDVVLDRARVLKAKENRRAAGLLRQTNVGGSCSFENQIR